MFAYKRIPLEFSNACLIINLKLSEVVYGHCSSEAFR